MGTTTQRPHDAGRDFQLALAGQRLVEGPLGDGGPGDIEQSGHLGVRLDPEELARLALRDGLVHGNRCSHLLAHVSSDLSAVRQNAKRSAKLSFLMDRSPISARLSAALADAGMTQAQLARAVSTTTATVANWMNDKVSLEGARADILFRISRVLRIRPEWLLYGENPKQAAVSPADSDAGPSHPVSLATLTMAIQLAVEVLDERGKTLPPAKRAEFIATLYDLIEEGMPEAKVLRFARAAAA